VIKATQLKVTATDDMSVAHMVKELAKHISGPALDLVSSQPRLSKRSNHGRRWTGLACKWKKTIGYFLTSSTKSPDLLNNIHLKRIKIPSEYGLIVKVCICDQALNNQ